MTADDFSAAPQAEAAPQTPEAIEQSNDAAMEAAWAEMNKEPERAEDGTFKAAETETPESAELEGAVEGEEAKEGNSAVAESDIPLPANLYGLDAEWAELKPEARQRFAERSNELNARMSDMGRQISQHKPFAEVASEFAEYFNGNLKGPDGEAVTPAAAAKYLFNIQRSVDANPPNAIMNIIDTYGAREQIAQLLGVQAAPQQQDNRLLARIDQLEAIIRQSNDPSRVEKVIDQREAQTETSRLLKSEPLVSEIPENRLVFFINEGWGKLGQTATREAVLKYAVQAATEADPALRAKSQAAVKAADTSKQKAEAAKRATGVNVTSTSSGKPRIMTDDEAMEAEWARMQSN